MVASKMILGINNFTMPGEPDQVTFICVELHMPTDGPLVKMIQVTLKILTVTDVCDSPVHRAVFSKQSEIGCDARWDVIDESEEKQ